MGGRGYHKEKPSTIRARLALSIIASVFDENREVESGDGDDGCDGKIFRGFLQSQSLDDRS